MDLSDQLRRALSDAQFTVEAPFTGVYEHIGYPMGSPVIEFSGKFDATDAAHALFSYMPAAGTMPHVLVLQIPVTAADIPALLRRLADYLETQEGT